MRELSNDLSSLALNTGTLGHNLDGHGAGWSPERVIDACAARDLGGIVWWRRELGERARDIGERVRAAGLEVVGLCRSPFLVGPLAPPTRTAVLDDFEGSIETAATLGAATLTIVVGGVESGTRGLDESLRRVADVLAEVAPRAADAGVTLALEPLHPVYAGDRSCLVTVRDALALCDAVDHPALAVAVDVYHVWWDRTLGETLAGAGAGRIAGLHLCDWLAETRDVLLDRGMMGDGVADIRGIRRMVEEAGYRGPCEVEIFSARDWWTREPDEVLDRCVERFRSVC